jgi:hypothetical protein
MSLHQLAVLSAVFLQTIENLIHLIQSQRLQNHAPRLNVKQQQSITATTEIRKDYKIPSLLNTSRITYFVVSAKSCK